MSTGAPSKRALTILLALCSGTTFSEELKPQTYFEISTYVALIDFSLENQSRCLGVSSRLGYFLKLHQRSLVPFQEKKKSN